MFFFEKKNQKTFVHWHTRPISSFIVQASEQQFLLLFFKKEGAFSYGVRLRASSGSMIGIPSRTG
jgi:hypothetical protein